MCHGRQLRTSVTLLRVRKEYLMIGNGPKGPQGLEFQLIRLVVIEHIS